ncbi:hypothetical protein WR25_19305 isoform D [Diploscapter pachys]|uniref:VPS9 domain-containing protein n=1 Tax=Diploscapter pachys TaxID=2018661 RepID=A0A2A2JUK5_9BILA|nr:hypothetical protein WR25_19305 isoform C [Diploscapter pachys]PAV65381.1 hypothetical protein WR25_19305 isoform D [Diploscapter pachys]
MGSEHPPVEEHDESKKLKVQIQEKDLLCINGCGFYGTPQWGNRCSKCWRSHLALMKKHHDFTKNRTLLSFDNFQERRKLSTESRSMTIKKIFKPSAMLGNPAEGQSQTMTPSSSMSPVTTPTRIRSLSPESKAAREAFSEYLSKNLPFLLVQDIVKTVKYATNKIHELNAISPDELSDLVQNFYQGVSEKLNHNPAFTSGKLKVRTQDVMEEIEKFLCVSCYSRLFCASSDEEVADVSLQDRIRSLHWVTAGFLETKLDFTNVSVRDKLDEAISQIIDMNGHRTAEEKLRCLIDCCHAIFEALKESVAPTSADEFLPVLIYVILKGNPPLIQSNVKFISRFALASRVMSGESGYFFTNLSCALQFVQEMNHESLRMNQDEFEAYTSGHLAPPLSLMNCACNQAIGSMERSLAEVGELLKKQQQLLVKIEELDVKMTKENEEMAVQFANFLKVNPSQKYLQMKEEREKVEQETKLACSLSDSCILGNKEMSSFEAEDRRAKYAVMPKSSNEGKMVKLEPKKLKTNKEVRTILPEDKYLDKLEKIIVRDYFPELPKLKAQAEYMDAQARNDVAKMRELQLRFKTQRRTDRRTSPSGRLATSPERRATSPARFDPDAPGPSGTGKPDRIDPSPMPYTNQEGDNDAESTTSSKTMKTSSSKKKDPASLSIDEYLNKYTSEDNASFEELTQIMRKKELAAKAWAFNAEKEHNQGKIAYGSMAADADVQLALRHNPEAASGN